MKTWEFEVLDPAYGQVTEGPVWDGSGLLFTRIQQSRIMRYDPAANSITIVRENTNYANGMTLGKFRGQTELALSRNSRSRNSRESAPSGHET